MADLSTVASLLTLEIDRAGRRFPQVPGAQRLMPRGRVRQVQTQPAEQLLPRRLYVAIGQQLPWSRIQSVDNPGRETVVGAYVASLRQLEVYREQFRQLICETCRANLEFRTEAAETNVEAREQVLRIKLDQLMNDAALDWDPIRNVVDANLLSQSPADYCERLDAAILEEVSNFSLQLFELLARLVDRELCGLVEWMPDQCCRYHFFRRVAIQADAYRSESVKVIAGSAGAETEAGSLQQVIGLRRTTTVETVPHEIRFARHEHEVIDAVRTSVGNSKVAMPPQIVRILEAIPAWLYPFVEVIDGQIVRERIIERDISVEDWIKTDVRDELIIGPDPGIIIGPYVLSAWSTREILSEQERCLAVEQSAKQNFRQSLLPVFVGAAILLSGAALWLQYGWHRDQGGLLFAILASATAIGCVWQALFDSATCRRSATASHYAGCTTLSAGFVLLLAEWSMARMFVPMSWLTPVVLLTAAVMTYHLGQHFR